MYSFENNGKTYFFKENESDKDKYVVFSCAKRENDYIREWVRHNLNIGFDKVIIADNNDDDSLETVLSDYISKEQVELFNCRGMKEFQCEIYNMFYHEGNYKWCAYIDCDEYIEIVRKNYNIKELLEEVKEDVLCLQWMMFTSNGIIRKNSTSIKERFLVPKSPVALCKENMFIKCIIRGGKKEGFFNASHYPATNTITFNLGGYCKLSEMSQQVWYPMKYKEAFIKHYYTKSYEEYLEKVKRGWPDGNQYEYLSDTTHYFSLADKKQLEPEDFAYNIFSGRKEYKELSDYINKEVNKYKIIVFNKDSHPYCQLYTIPLVMTLLKDKIFLIFEDSMDDTLFNSIYEMSFKTSNKLYTIKDMEDCYYMLNKYNEEYYFMIY